MTPRFHFFGGKGGVGKTTCSAATAIYSAEAGARVLLVSTDPAHSLGDALGVRLTDRPKKIAGVRGRLDGLELDGPLALERWLAPRRRLLAQIAERGTYFDRGDIERLLELSFPGVDELVALVEILRLSREGAWDEVVVDTAPTGHTLRLLAMPDTLDQLAFVLDQMQRKHRMLVAALARTRRADEADEVIAALHDDARLLHDLVRDEGSTSVTWVAHAEEVVVAETRDALSALTKTGIAVKRLVINRLTRTPRGRCAHCEARVAAEAEALRSLAEASALPQVVALFDLGQEPVGVDALRRVGKKLSRPEPLPTSRRALRRRTAGKRKAIGKSAVPFEVPEALRLLFVGGKGGVGKSSTAAACALALAKSRPGARVLLLSADPAHSLGDVLGQPGGDEERAVAGGPANLTFRELDAHQSFASQKQKLRDAVDELFDAMRGDSRFDASFDRAIIRDLIDCAPPGVDEIFAVLSLLDSVLAPPGHEGRRDLLVIDTAPTGHALRLLEMPVTAGAWVRAILELLLKYRQVAALGTLAQELVDASRKLRSLQSLLEDAGATRFVIVTRPSTLPTEETVRLGSALQRLGVRVGAVFVNHLTPAEPPSCAPCRARSRMERAQVEALLGGRKNALRHLGVPVILSPAVVPPPRGPAQLVGWSARWAPLDVAEPRKRSRPRNTAR